MMIPQYFFKNRQYHAPLHVYPYEKIGWKQLSPFNSITGIHFPSLLTLTSNIDKYDII